MDKVDLNTATFEQLRALLGLTASDYKALEAARPLSTPADVARALPARLQGRATSTEIPKRDINEATEAEVSELAGVSLEAARAIKEHGPYDFMSELAALPSVRAVLPQVAAVFAAPPRSYVDKLTNRRVVLSPDPARVVIAGEKGAESDAEGAGAQQSLRRMGLEPVLRSKSASGITVYALPEAEAAGDVLQRLKTMFGGLVTPVFRDASGADRYMDPRYCVVQFQRGTPDEVQRDILGELGLAIEQRFRTPGFYLLRVPGGTQAALFQKLDALNARAEVKFVEPNYRGFDDIESPGAAPLAGPPPGAAWHLGMLRVDEAWRRGTGSGDVIIAVLDSGVDAAHPALQGAIVPRGNADDWDFTIDGGEAPEDEMGHGTFIAGLLVGNGALGVRGICPGCQVLPLKVPLLGERDSYIRRREALLYAVDTLPPGKRLVVNMSWKTAGDIALLRDAIETAAAAGAVLVASAGNTPQRANEPHYPSDYEQVISVAAVDARRKRSWFSFYGDQVDLAAPGGTDVGGPDERLFSAAPGGDVVDSCGTSFAAPQVAGVAALLLSAFPALTPADVRRALESSAAPLAEDGLGKGLVDAAAALAAAERLALGKGAVRASGDEPARATTALAAINQLDVDALVQRYGLLPISARIIAARRPWPSIDAVRGVLGVTGEQMRRLEEDGALVAANDAEALAATSEQAALDPVRHGVLPVLQWSTTESFQASLFDGHRERTTASFQRAVARFVKAGVGQRLSRLVAELPRDALDRLILSPEAVRRLRSGETTDLSFFLVAVLAEHRRLGGVSGLEEPVWSALGDMYLPAGARGPLPPPGELRVWRDGAAYSAPRLGGGVVLDLASPAARAPVPNVVLGEFTPYTEREARALVDKLGAAVDVIDRACPAAARLFRRFVSVIVVRKDDRAPNSLANFSANDQPGRITLVNAHAPYFTPAVLADRIVHESIHSFLYIVEATHSFTPDERAIDAIESRSPWTGNMLSLHSFLHACLVWFGLWKFWERARAARVLPEEVSAGLDRAQKGFRDPALPGLIERVLPFVSAEARALFPALVRDVRAGVYG
ncbi:S8 family serine peptidase [Sorangium sp. So ce1151]|uniref:S8 family serine peptidase n=1 Tax=Sorangium sp. So ce1151 TaxID=3133332 RepID=UPI003F621380